MQVRCKNRVTNLATFCVVRTDVSQNSALIAVFKCKNRTENLKQTKLGTAPKICFICRISSRRLDKCIGKPVSLHCEPTMDILTKEEVSRIAVKVAAGEEARLIDYEVGSRSEEALGHLGKHLTLTLHLSSRGVTKRRRLFLKTYEVRANKDDFLGETGLFKREQDFYRIVLEDMKDVVGVQDWCPRYHFSKERVLVLEDLSESGFEMVRDGQGPWALDDAHLEQVLRALASMHAASMFVEHEESKRLPSIYPTVFRREMLYDERNLKTPTRKWIGWQIQDLLEGVTYLDKYSHREKILIRNDLERQIMKIYSLSKPSEKYRNVITHGDMWKNNLLFLYASDGHPKDCKLVDFQFIRYAPPAHDIMHLLCYATKKERRERMESHFLPLYYENLRKRMRENGLDVEKEVAMEELLSSCKEYKELALIQCLLSLHYLLGPVSLSVEAESYEKYEDYLTNHRKQYMSKFFNNETYVDKIRDLFEELIDTYILKC